MAPCFYLLFFVLVVFTDQSEAQASTVRPIRHSLPDTLESVNGSSSDGGCTLRDGSICNLQDGGTSVLFDNTILPLSGLDGNQWARDLFTLRRPFVGAFISIGFDFGTLVPVRRVELVLFNCQEWSIRASDIEVYVSSINIFPRSDPTALPRAGGRLRRAGDNSCENLYRVCVSLVIQTQVYYIVFPNAVESDWVHLAEVTFYNDTDQCAGRETLITEPVTPPTETTTKAGQPTTPNPTQSVTTNQQSTIQSTTTQSSLGIILGVVISTVVVILTSVAIIILVVILCWTKRQPQLKTANETKEPVYEAVDDQGGVPLGYEVPVFNNGGTTSKQTIEMTPNIAYGHVAAGSGPNELHSVNHDDNTTDPDTEYDYVNSDLSPHTKVVTSGQVPTARSFEMETNIAYVQTSHT